MQEHDKDSEISKNEQVTFFTEVNEEEEELSSPEILPEQGIELTEAEASDAVIEPLPITDTDRPKKKTLSDLCKESVIIAFFIFVGTGIARLMRGSFTAAVFTAYDKTASAFKNTFLSKTLFGTKASGIISEAKKNVRRAATNAIIPKAVSKLLTAMLTVRTRIYALILLAFGSVTLFIHFFINRYFSLFLYDTSAPITGTLVIVAAIFLLLANGTITETVYKSRLLSALFFKLLGIKRTSIASKESPELSGSGACILGILLGLMTLVIPANMILLTIAVVLYTFIVIKSPEAGLIFVYLMTPFAPNSFLMYSIAILAVSYLFKAACGKRTIQLEFMDMFVGAFAFIMFASGIITFGEKNTVLQSLLYTVIYLISVSILRSSIWFERAMSSFIFSISAVTVSSVFYAVISRIGNSGDLWSSVSDELGAKGNAFNSGAVICLILLFSFFYLLSYVITANNKGQRFGFIFLSAISAVFLIMNLSPGAWSAAIIACIVFLLLMDSRSAIYILIACVMLPFLPVFGLSSVEGFFANLLPDKTRMSLWNAVIRMFPKYGFSGIGNGTEAFGDIYPTFFIGNTESVGHAASLIMQLTISLGFIGIVVYLLSLFFILQSSFSYGRSCSDKLSQSRIVTYAGMCGLIAATLCGINEFIWFEPRIMLIYWEIAALTVSTRRSALSSSENSAMIDDEPIYT